MIALAIAALLYFCATIWVLGKIYSGVLRGFFAMTMVWLSLFLIPLLVVLFGALLEKVSGCSSSPVATEPCFFLWVNMTDVLPGMLMAGYLAVFWGIPWLGGFGVVFVIYSISVAVNQMKSGR